GGSLAGDNESVVSSLYNVFAGTAVASSGLPNVKAACPVFSPDGKHVAFNFWGGSATISSTTADKRSLVELDFTNSTNTFSNARVVAKPNTNGLAAVPATGTYPSGRTAWPSFFTSAATPSVFDKIAYEWELYGNNYDVYAATRSQCDCSDSRSSEGVHAEL